MRDDEKTAIMKAQGRRLRTIRQAAPAFRKSARAAALAAGWPESTYRSHEGGTRQIDPYDAATYVTFFLKNGARGENFTPRWVIYGDEEELVAADFEDVVRDESPAFRKMAYKELMAFKARYKNSPPPANPGSKAKRLRRPG